MMASTWLATSTRPGRNDESTLPACTVTANSSLRIALWMSRYRSSVTISRAEVAGLVWLAGVVMTMLT